MKTVKLSQTGSANWSVFPPVLEKLLWGFEVDLLKSWSESKQDAAALSFLRLGRRVGMANVGAFNGC